MFLTKCSIIQIIHTADTHSDVADMLSRDFFYYYQKTCKLHQKTLSAHFEIPQLQPDNSLKQVHYSAKHEENYLFKETICTQLFSIMILSSSRFEL